MLTLDKEEGEGNGEKVTITATAKPNTGLKRTATLTIVSDGYETEIKYQRHMLENLGRWFSILFIIASIGVVLIYLFHKSFLPLLILGILLALVGILGMIVFGYGIYRGLINLHIVIDDFNQKLTFLN